MTLTTSSASNSLAADESVNVTGALLFFTYILAALFFSIYIVRSISQIPDHEQDAYQPGHGKRPLRSQKEADKIRRAQAGRQEFSMFSALALASFSILSWNMLNFLITSYSTWAVRNNFPVAFRIDDFQHIQRQVQLIWRWALDSNLFQTFAEDLVADPSKWKFVRVALVYSYTWNSWMSTLGHGAEVPALWAYFVLDQILPVSFTQNLFCAALMRKMPYSRQRLGIGATGYTVWGLKTTGLACYCGALYWIPSFVGTQWFFPTLFSLRMLLFAPYLFDHFISWSHTPNTIRTTDDFSKFDKYLLAGSIAYGIINIGQLEVSDLITSASSSANYAVAALVNDMVVGVVSGLALFLIAIKQNP